MDSLKFVIYISGVDWVDVFVLTVLQLLVALPHLINKDETFIFISFPVFMYIYTYMLLKITRVTRILLSWTTATV